MKYLVMLCDGMADKPFPALQNKTPMMLAYKPTMDMLAKTAEVGLCRTVAAGLKPGSDVANLSVMGYDPLECYTGRSPLEAASIGVDLKDTDVALRCNLVTLSDEENYADKTMVDYCAGDISTAEAAEIMKTVQETLGSDLFTFYPGVSYRHCLVVANGTTDLGEMTPPHDISGRVVGEYLSKAEAAQPLVDLMKRSVDILKDHPVNKARIAKGERPVSSIWLWGEGKKPQLEDFKEKNGVSAGVISAVDLLKGIGVCANMEIPDVEGATGYLDTNFTGKADAAKALFDKGVELVYVHVEAPDECGHRGEAENKVKAIEEIDKQILTPLVEYLKEKDDFRILVMPDHPTPLETRTHCSDPVPFMLYDSRKALGGVDTFTEDTAAATGVMIAHGSSVMARLLER